MIIILILIITILTLLPHTMLTGMLAHCGYENDMKLTASEGISKQLLCAMRVHLMNETEVYIFCPANVLVWEENCHNVAFANYTAISPTNEQAVIHALRGTLYSMLNAYPTTIQEDRLKLGQVEEGRRVMGPVMLSAVKLRFR